MAVKIVFKIIKKAGETVMDSPETLVAAVRAYVEELERKQFALTTDVEFRRGLLGSEATLPGEGAAASNQDHYNVQARSADNLTCRHWECRALISSFLCLADAVAWAVASSGSTQAFPTLNGVKWG